MLRKKLGTLALFATASGQVSCFMYGGPESFYVVVNPTEAERYYRDMASAVALHGLDSYPSALDDGRGGTLFAVEGVGRGVRVWSINLPMSERESVACGGPKRPGIDPGQFVVTVYDRNLFEEDQVLAVKSELMASLREKAYDVRMRPRSCAAENSEQ